MGDQNNQIGGNKPEVKKKFDLGNIKARISAFKMPDLKKLGKLDAKKIKEILTDKKNIRFVKKNMIWIVLGVFVMTLILAKTVGKIKTIIFGPKKAEKEMVEFLETIPVKCYKVKRMDFKDTLPVMGRIEGFKEIELRFEASGILESFNFEEGERILEGDIIASLSQKDALLKLKYAAIEMEKAKRLYELGGYDKIAYEQKNLEYESAKRDLEKTNIYAPADGYLGSREKSAGAYLTSQDKVGTFVDYSEVYAAFDVIEEDSPKIQLGQTVDIFLDAYPTDTMSGTVDMVAPMIQGRTRTQKVKVELENEEGKMKPGMFARGIINTYEKKDALIIPASAFKKKEQQYFVYVVHLKEEEEEGKEGGGEGTEEEKAEEGKEPLEKKAEKEIKEPEDENIIEEKMPEKPQKEGPPQEGEAPPAEGGEEETMMGIVEERPVEIAYLTHDMAEIGKGLEEGELIIRELHQEFKDKDEVEVTEVQETIF